MASVQCALALVSLSGVGDKVGLRAVVRAIRSLKGSDRANAEAAKLVLSVAPFASQAIEEAWGARFSDGDGAAHRGAIGQRSCSGA